MKNTRELAEVLRKTAAFLDSKDSFEVEGLFCIASEKPSLSYYDKGRFVAGVKAMGRATKRYGDGDYAQLYVTSTEFPLTLSISRDKVCKKKVTFECEALFSSEEEDALGVSNA